MKCINAVCPRSTENGDALYRQNPKGEAGIFACREHNQQPIDPEVLEITELIEREQGRKV